MPPHSRGRCIPTFTFKHLPDLITTDAIANDPVNEHDCFSSYFRSLSAILRIADSYSEKRFLAHWEVKALSRAILRAAILGRSKDLHTHHNSFVEEVLDLLERGQQYEAMEVQAQTIVHAQDQGAVLHRTLIELTKSLPTRSDMSDLTTAHVGSAIARWRDAHKAKFMAHRQKLGIKDAERAAKRNMRKMQSAKSAADAVEFLIDDERIYYWNHEYLSRRGYDFLQDEAEDIDGVVWSRRK